MRQLRLALGQIMEATLSQKDGLKLNIESCPQSGNDILIVRLIGTNFHAEVTVGNQPSAEESGQLATFLATAASIKLGESPEWLSFCQDLSFSASMEPGFDGLILLKVYIGSNSDDECDWQINASLLVEPEKLYSFALAVPRPER